MTARDTAYHEGHSALNGRFLALALVGPAAGLAACVLLAVAVSPAWAAGIGVMAVLGLMLAGLLRKSPQYDTMTNRWAAGRAMRHCNVGVLSSPWMQAALVIDIRPGAVTTPQVRPARFYGNFMGGSLSRLLPPVPSLTWVIPTRHPGQHR